MSEASTRSRSSSPETTSRAPSDPVAKKVYDSDGIKRAALQASGQAPTPGVLAEHGLRYLIFTGTLGLLFRSFRSFRSTSNCAADWTTWTWHWAWYLAVAYWTTSLVEYIPHRFEYHSPLTWESAVRHRVHHYATARAPKGKLQQGLGLGYGSYHLPPFSWAAKLWGACNDATDHATDRENEDEASSSRAHVDDEKLLRARFCDVVNFLRHVLLWYAIQTMSVRLFFPQLPAPRLLEASAVVLLDFLLWDAFHPLCHDHMGSFDEHSERHGPPELLRSFLDEHRDEILGTWPVSWLHAHHEAHHAAPRSNFCGNFLGADLVFGCQKIPSAVHPGKLVSPGQYVRERLMI